MILPRFKVVAGAVIHLRPAVCTADNTGEHIAFADSRRSALVLPNLLYSCKGFLVDDGFMRVREDHPFSFGIVDLLFALVRLLVRFEVHHVTEVYTHTPVSYGHGRKAYMGSVQSRF